MNTDTLLIYCAVAFFYIISPGPAVFLAVYNGALHGIRCVAASALGNIMGLFVLSALSASGLSAILMTSSSLFTLVKTIGAAYLIYLGIKQWRSSKALNGQTLSEAQGSGEKAWSLYFREGFVVAITNPKPIVFFAALFPQFLTIGSAVLPQFTIMTGVFMLFSFMSLVTYGYLGSKAKRLLSDGEKVKWFHRISGGLFVGMGISLFTVKSTA